MTSAVSSVGLRFLKLGFGEAAARILAFFATVYLARTLGASIYGVLVAAMTVVMYLTFVADCGIEMLGVREVADRPDALSQTLPPILGGRVLVAIALLAVTLVVALTVVPKPDGPVLAVYAVTLLTVAMGTRWVHLGLEQPGNASWSRVISEGTAALIVLLAVRHPDDLLRVPLAQVLGELLGAIFLIRLLPATVRPLRLQMRPAVLVPLVRRSWPMVLHGLLGLAIYNSDFLFLRAIKGSTAVGYYAAAYTLISFFQNLGVAYTMSLIPSLTRVRHDAMAARALVDGATVQILAGGLPVAAGGIVVAMSLVTFIFGAGYAPSALPLQILLVIVPVALVRNVGQGVLIAFERQDLMLRTVLWAAGANVVLNIVLIPRWGMTGAAAATLATEMVRTGLALRYSWRLGLSMTAPRRFYRVGIATSIMALTVWVLGDRSVLLSVPIGALAYVGALLAVGGIRLRRGAFPELAL
ncbi:MAG: oligosaccharide flippase family protein [Gemmatimonadaceae bacterium]|nr:oligosaccharide flippase family protein [Gemmatimonadaceae bacterium]